MDKSLKIILGVLAGLGILALLVVFWFIGSYNGLVKLDTTTEQTWADVETQYQRRVDLIPNLVETVKGYASHEEDVFTEVTRQRSAWANAKSPTEQIAAAQGMESAISRLLLVSENYPQLKANENFLSLQDELAGTENRVSVARTRYNEAAANYNAKIRTFPTAIVAGMFDFEKRDFFEAHAGAENAPKVEFG